MLGLVHAATELQVTACSPDCATLNGWALLSPQGAIRLTSLRLLPDSEGTGGPPAAMAFQYGRVIRTPWPSYTKPNTAASKREIFKAGQELAFRGPEAGVPDGWLKRLDGSYMSKAGVQPLVPSAFAGERNPALPLAFIIHQTLLQKDRGDAVSLSRYQRLSVLVDAPAPQGLVRTAEGMLPRNAIRLVVPQARPPAIPADARWVHVNRQEQTLAAYEGDHVVFATLVSTGKPETPTPAGLYQISYKALHDNMHGEPDDPYLVEEVPFAMFFLHGMGLHGTYWHDRFGTEVSHGCVNLSIQDAAWLFDWAPPTLPSGWEGIFPRERTDQVLWVLIR